jgi:hypothetical protein
MLLLLSEKHGSLQMQRWLRSEAVIANPLVKSTDAIVLLEVPSLPLLLSPAPPPPLLLLCSPLALMHLPFLVPLLL